MPAAAVLSHLLRALRTRQARYKKQMTAYTVRAQDRHKK